VADTQEFVDRFYMAHRPCCAGCDHWRFINSSVGECRLSPPVDGDERVSLLGMRGLSLPRAGGHILTPRDHHCGAFSDTFDWASLPRWYLHEIGASLLPASSDQPGGAECR
jgi:hypothetical protein